MQLKPSSLPLLTATPHRRLNCTKMASSVMDRPEEGRIHELAKRAAPGAIEKLNEHLANPKSRVVAIERHDCDWRDGRKHDRERFLWIKAKLVSERSHYFTETACCHLPSALCMRLPLTLILETHRRRHQEQLSLTLQARSRTT